MRSVKYSLALASLGGLVAFVSCTLITDVDRSKIPNTDASASAGEAGMSASSGGTAGTSSGGSAGHGGSAHGGSAQGVAGEAGESSGGM
ncbi:MAG TPA: hypothetical protein VNW92_19110, partial [Polyangiaceae bacterium]|nr:hypothetical protein [Polyangiaceae bacterium]